MCAGRNQANCHPKRKSTPIETIFSHRKHFSVFLLKIFSTSERSDGKKSCTTAPLTLKLGSSSRTTLRSNSFVHNRVGKYRVNSHFSLASVETLLLFDPPYFLFVCLWTHLLPLSRSSLTWRRCRSMMDFRRERSPTPAWGDKNRF